MIDGFDDKYVLYKMITCPIDIKDKKVVDLWNHYCCTYTADCISGAAGTVPGEKRRYPAVETVL